MQQADTIPEPRLGELTPLLMAAAALPGLCILPNLCAPPGAKAQTMPTQTTVQLQYAYFEEYQRGHKDRINVQAPMLRINAPIAETTELELNAAYDTVSGASPIYHDTLSGASGRRIVDDRNQADLTLTRYFDRWSISLGITGSTEDDYESVGANMAARLWSLDKNSVLLLGLNHNDDDVSSASNPMLDETRRSTGAIVGLTQVLSRSWHMQTNLSYTSEDGYLTDPYKLADHRPASRDRLAWLIRSVQYVEPFAASLHLDYRLTYDSWSLTSHMVEATWYQPLNEQESWFLRPRLRYATQEQANFYSDQEPLEILDDRFYSADQRLSSFGSFGCGLKLMHSFESDLAVSVSYDRIMEDSSWALFSSGSPGIDRLTMHVVTVGLEKRF